MRAFCSGSGPSADWLLRRTVGPFRAVGQRILDGKSALSAVHGCLAGARSSRTARDASNWREDIRGPGLPRLLSLSIFGQ